MPPGTAFFIPAPKGQRDFLYPYHNDSIRNQPHAKRSPLPRPSRIAEEDSLLDKDLMMLPEKKEGWVNIYKSDNGTYYTGAIFYEKNDALVNTSEIEITTGIPRDCIDTVKIEWEE